MLRWVLVLCTWTLVLHTSHATTSTTFRHAWQQYCSGRETKCSGAHIPQKAYVISLPDDVEKRDYLLPQLKTLGLEVEVVDGIHADQVPPQLLLRVKETSIPLLRVRSHVVTTAHLR